MPIRRIVATHYHPDHVGNAEWLSARFGAPVAMTHAEYLTAHASAGQFGGYTPRRRSASFAATECPRSDLAALEKRGNNYRRGVPDLPQSFDRMLGGESGGRAVQAGASSADTAIRRSTRRFTAPSAAC